MAYDVEKNPVQVLERNSEDVPGNGTSQKSDEEEAALLCGENKKRPLSRQVRHGSGVSHVRPVQRDGQGQKGCTGQGGVQRLGVGEGGGQVAEGVWETERLQVPPRDKHRRSGRLHHLLQEGDWQACLTGKPYSSTSTKVAAVRVR